MVHVTHLSDSRVGALDVCAGEVKPAAGVGVGHGTVLA